MFQEAIVDTNIPVVANERAVQASPACVLQCKQFLREFTEDQRILVIDSGWRIIKEYKQHLRQEGQPGVGDRFLKWVLTNLANPQRCRQVAITPVGDGREFAEFPDDPALARFDRSDRKFVAVARACPSHPPVSNAVDSDWVHYRQLLAMHNVQVVQVCQSE